MQRVFNLTGQWEMMAGWLCQLLLFGEDCWHAGPKKLRGTDQKAG